MRVNIKAVTEIIDCYGEKHQIVKAAEELSELTTVILQVITKNEKDIAHITEELADVYVMLKQLELIFCLDDRDIQPIIDAKIERAINEFWKEETY